MNLLVLARFICDAAHQGQTRRDSVTPYKVHPYAVAERLRLAGYSEDAQAVAYLHDTMVDEGGTMTATNLDDLGVPHHIIHATLAISKKKGESYKDYLKRVKGNDLARSVKLFDIEDNLADSPTEHQVEKYKFAKEFLK